MMSGLRPENWTGYISYTIGDIKLKIYMNNVHNINVILCKFG